jgi:hypothetical protein
MQHFPAWCGAGPLDRCQNAILILTLVTGAVMAGLVIMILLIVRVDGRRQVFSQRRPNNHHSNDDDVVSPMGQAPTMQFPLLQPRQLGTSCAAINLTAFRPERNRRSAARRLRGKKWIDRNKTLRMESL